MTLTTRQKNIIRRMAYGEAYYSLGSPRMTQREADELWELGFKIQSASAHGADSSGGRVYYPLHGRGSFLSRLGETASAGETESAEESEGKQ